MITQTRQNHLLWFVLLSTVLLASILLPMPGHDERVAGLPSICLFYNLTGLPCPACGLTRAFICIGHGHLGQSLHWHPLGLPLFVLFALLWLRSGVWLWRKQDIYLTIPLRYHRIWLVMGILFLVVGLSRTYWFAVHHIQF